MAAPRRPITDYPLPLAGPACALEVSSSQGLPVVPCQDDAPFSPLSAAPSLTVFAAS